MRRMSLVGPEVYDVSKWVRLAWHDTIQMYRRTLFGPFWLTLNMAIFAFAMTLIYSAVFQTPPGEYSVYIVCSMMVWWWVLGVLNEGGAVFLTYANFIQAKTCDKTMFVWSMGARQLIALIHHSAIYFILIIVGLLDLSWYMLLVIPMGLLLFLWTVPIISILAILSVRFRDIQRLIGAAAIILMMVTPIFWKPGMVEGWRTLIFELNPVYYAVEGLRRPLLGEPVPMDIFVPLVILIAGTWVFANWFYRRYERHVIFWL